LRDTISKISNTKKGWQSGSSDRDPAQQAMKSSVQTSIPPKKKRKTAFL
jgi:hypothetical protein